MREDRSVLELLSANYSFVNERLARHYGIPNIHGMTSGASFPADGPRGGLLGQGSILTLTSYSTRTSPVLRGKYVLENLLASPPPPRLPTFHRSRRMARRPTSNSLCGRPWSNTAQIRPAPVATPAWTPSVSLWRISMRWGGGATTIAASP